MNTGKPHWTHDLLAAIWGSPMVINGKVYLGDEDGDVVVLEASTVKKLIAEMNMGSAVYSTPVPANGTLFIDEPESALGARGEAVTACRGPRCDCC